MDFVSLFNFLFSVLYFWPFFENHMRPFFFWFLYLLNPLFIRLIHMSIHLIGLKHWVCILYMYAHSFERLWVKFISLDGSFQFSVVCILWHLATSRNEGVWWILSLVPFEPGLEGVGPPPPRNWFDRRGPRAGVWKKSSFYFWIWLIFHFQVKHVSIFFTIFSFTRT